MDENNGETNMASKQWRAKKNIEQNTTNMQKMTVRWKQQRGRMKTMMKDTQCNEQGWVWKQLYSMIYLLSNVSMEEQHRWWKKWKQITTTMKRETEKVGILFINRVKGIRKGLVTFLFFICRQLNFVVPDASVILVWTQKPQLQITTNHILQDKPEGKPA